jgi:hypothetical protein|tara:strand:+ start:1867 stop:2592 length:726 start_codon:yes stop_codon:yes gene_type:complete
MAGTLTGANIITRVQDTLQDTTSVRWPEAELLRYINDAQREIVNFKPGASSKTANMQLVTGTLQSLPTEGLRLIKVTRNMSDASGGATGARAIRLVNSDILNTQEPDWNNPSVSGDAAHGTTVKHYVFDDDDPRKFYVYPGVAGNAYVEIVYSKSPTDLSSASSTIDVDDIYGNAIVDFVLYRAYMKDAEYAANSQRAGQHYQLFTASIGQGGQSQMLVDPNNDPVSNIGSVPKIMQQRGN